MHKPEELRYEADRGICPYCRVFSHFKWSTLYAMEFGRYTNFRAGNCSHCDQDSLWMEEPSPQEIYPKPLSACLPHDLMPQSLQGDFEEARRVVTDSPRAAAAMLRLCVQKLCNELDVDSRDINKGIGELVKKGLPVPIQQAMDVVRVIGNESVHPGELDLNDDQETAHRLFELVNIVIETMIAQPARIQSMYNSLPAAKLQGIANRDKASNA